jgi:hypothetical protein
MLPLYADSLVPVHTLPLAASDPQLILDMETVSAIFSGTNASACCIVAG